MKTAEEVEEVLVLARQLALGIIAESRGCRWACVTTAEELLTILDKKEKHHGIERTAEN